MTEDAKQSQSFDSDSSEEPSAQSLPDLTRRLAHSLQKPFNCQTCSKKFASKKSLADHMRAHSGEKPFQCEVCAKLFLRSGDLKRHLMMHSGEKPFQCEICQKQFPRKGNLQLHRITHTKSRPHQCALCLRFFAQKSGLTQHMLVHTGIKRFQCELCLKEFARKAYLQKHMLSHRAVPLDCEVCGKTFSASRNLKLHALSHNVRKMYRCYLCEDIFKEKGAYHKHIASHNEPIECRVCFKQFSNMYLLEKHSQIHASGGDKVLEEIAEDMDLGDSAEMDREHCDIETDNVINMSGDADRALWTDGNCNTVHVKTENVDIVPADIENTQLQNESHRDGKYSDVHSVLLQVVTEADEKYSNVHSVQNENIMKEVCVNGQHRDFKVEQTDEDQPNVYSVLLKKIPSADEKHCSILHLEDENITEVEVSTHNEEIGKVFS